jgi:FAD/FMN-containing dehydrogenase
MAITDTLLGDDLEPLARLIKGQVVTPADPEWARHRLGWNLAVDLQPRAVVYVADVDDVVEVARYAAQRGLPITAQPSGHGVTSALNGAIVLRMAALQELVVDVETRTARIGAGVKWQQVNQALTGTGLSGLPGSSGDIAVVGYSLGGGMSWFGRAFGLACDRIRAIECVTATGELILVSPESDPELFRAMRGAGGDFAIVTAIEIELVELDRLYGGRMVWPGDQTEAVLTAAAELMPALPDEMTIWSWLLNLPDLPFIPEPLRGKRAVAVDCTYLGDAARAEQMLAPLLDRLPPPMLDTRAQLPLAAVGDICAEPVSPIPFVEGSALLTRFDAETAAALTRAVGLDRPSALTLVEVRQLGAAMSRPTAAQGALAPLAQPYAVLVIAMAPTPEIAALAQVELEALHAALADAESGLQTPNFGPLAEGNYPPDTLAWLATVKQRVDPNSIIRSNRPVLAPSSPAASNSGPLDPAH